MFIIIVLGRVLTPSFPVSSQDFYCSLPRDQIRDATPRLSVFDILRCTPFRLRISPVVGGTVGVGGNQRGVWGVVPEA